MSEPSTASELIDYGIGAFHSAELDSAEHFFDRALEAGIRLEEAMNYKGLIAMQRQDMATATDWWIKSIDHKENLDALCNLGFHYAGQHEYKKAWPLLEKAWSMDTARQDLLVQLASIALEEKALKKAEDLLAPHMNTEVPVVHVHMTMARVKLEQKKPSEAIDLLTALWEKHPKCSDALQQIAKIYWQQEQYEKAEEYYLKTLEIIPEHGDVSKEYGTLLRDHIDVQRSIDLYKTMLQKTDQDFELHYLIASGYEKVKDYHMALKHYKRAFELYPIVDQIKLKVLQMEAAVQAQ